MLPKLKLAVFILCAIPAGQLAYDAYTGDLGVNPIETITRFTGSWSLIFLLTSLSVTPLRRLTGRNELIKFRRMLGLFAFFYASLHFATYIGLDLFFDFKAIGKDIVKRPYITVGFTAFVIMVPLAITSTAGMIRRLGQRWQKLHRLGYLATIAGVIHFYWLGQSRHPPGGFNTARFWQCCWVFASWQRAPRHSCKSPFIQLVHPGKFPKNLNPQIIPLFSKTGLKGEISPQIQVKTSLP